MKEAGEELTQSKQKSDLNTAINQLTEQYNIAQSTLKKYARYKKEIETKKYV